MTLSVPAPRRLRVGGRILASAAGTFVLTVVAMLALLAIVPAVCMGWHVYTVQSGSMAPAISRGDMLLASRSPSQHLAPGAVVVFRRSDHRIVSHRIVTTGPLGYVTRGDANPSPDSDLVRPASVLGVGRVMVPYAGLPAVWWQQRDFAPLAVFAVVLVAALVVAPVPKLRSRAT